MRAIYAGYKWYFIPIFAIYPFATLITGLSGAEGLLSIIIVPIAMIIGMGIIASKCFGAAKKESPEASSMLTTMGSGAAILCIPAILSMIQILTSNSSDALAWGTLLINIVGCSFMALAHNKIANDSGLRGSNLSAKGWWVLISCILLGVLLAIILVNLDKPYYGYYGYNSDSYESFMLKTLMLTSLIITCAIAALGAIFAIIYGTRFMIDSAEEIESYEEDQSVDAGPSQTEAAAEDSTRML